MVFTETWIKSYVSDAQINMYPHTRLTDLIDNLELEVGALPTFMIAFVLESLLNLIIVFVKQLLFHWRKPSLLL